MKARAVFVGERRSKSAKRMRVRWEDGRLAAKQLFDALSACNVDPLQCRFFNLFERGGIARLREERTTGAPLVAMGRKVQRELSRRGVPHIPLTHPAARGRVRLKANYIAEVREALRLIEGKAAA